MRRLVVLIVLLGFADCSKGPSEPRPIPSPSVPPPPLPPPPPPPPPPTPPGFEYVGSLGDWIVGSSVNDPGTVVGISSPNEHGSRPVRAQNGTLRVMDHLPGISYDSKVGTARSINQAGTIAGVLGGPGPFWHVTLWDSMGTRLSSTPLAADSAWWADVVKVNESGAVLAWWKSDPSQTGGVVVDHGSVRWIAYLAEIPSAVPFDINDLNQVVGQGAWYYAPGSTRGDTWRESPNGVVHHPYLWDNGVMRDLGVFGRTTECTRAARCASGAALAINNASQVVGYAEDSNLVRRPFVWRDERLTDLGVFPGTPAVARAINSLGQIAGDGDGGAFLWDNGVVRILGSLGGGYTEVTDMNDRGDVVGTSLTSNGEQHAFIYTDGRMIDLGLILGGACGTKATAVNRRGDVLIALMVPHNGECLYTYDDPRLIDFRYGRPQRAVVWHPPTP